MPHQDKINRLKKCLETQEQATQGSFDFESLCFEDEQSFPIQKEEASKLTKERDILLPVAHANRDFFLCDLFDFHWKEDSATLEAPIFTLSTKPDLRQWKWSSKDGTKNVTVTPSILGRATQMDKDVLIFIVSQLTEGLNRERVDAKQRKVRFTVHHYLIATNKPTGGIEYKRMELALRRLTGTMIETDIKTGGTRIREGFGILDSWKVVEKSPNDETMIAVEVTVSEWLYNSIHSREILTINPDYFRLRKPLERRIYELARKHCGQQTKWKVNLSILHEKTGSMMLLKEFKRKMKQIIELGVLPDYRIVMDDSDNVTFFSKNTQQIVNILLN
ncbi:MAG: plasmid replication initiator-like protein [Chitinophagia bacterium]|nr:plasmid replication initiator-like protein [Chitinophagia bacterium]